MRLVCISINVCNKKLHSHSESKCNSFHRFNSTLKIKFLFLLPKCTDVHIINSSSHLLFVHDENRVHWTHLLIYVLKWGKRKYNSGLFLCSSLQTNQKCFSKLGTCVLSSQLQTSAGPKVKHVYQSGCGASRLPQSPLSQQIGPNELPISLHVPLITVPLRAQRARLPACDWESNRHAAAIKGSCPP